MIGGAKRNRGGAGEAPPEAFLGVPLRRPDPVAEASEASLGAAERLAPACPLRRRWRHRLAGLLASGVLHLGIAAAAMAFLPAVPRMEIARGGLDDALEMTIVGAEELSAAIEGAKPEPASLVLPAPPEIEPPVLPVDPRPAAPEVAPAPPEPRADVPVQPEPRAETLPEGEVPVPVPPRQSVADPPRPAPPPPPPQPARAAPPPKLAAPPPAPRRKAAPPKRAPKEASDTARGSQGEGEAATRRSATGRGGSGGAAPTAGAAVISNYRARLVAHLARYKTYPEQAQERGIGGRNAVTLTIARDGRVLSAALAGSSGHSLLDAATMAAVRRAQPFPAMPEGAKAPITVTIGLRYDLR